MYFVEICKHFCQKVFSRFIGELRTLRQKLVTAFQPMISLMIQLCQWIEISQQTYRKGYITRN